MSELSSTQTPVVPHDRLWRVPVAVRTYGCAVGSIALALCVRLLIHPAVGFQFPFATFFFAVLVTAWYGGRGPALFAVVLGAFTTSYFLLSPIGSFRLSNPEQRAGMVLYLATGGGIALLGGAMRAARRQAGTSALELHAQEEVARALRTGEERLRLTLEGIKDYAVCMLDTEGTIVTWNSGAERILGYGVAEIIGQSFLRLYLSEEVEAGIPQRKLREAREGGSQESEGWRVRKDGSRFWGSGILSRLQDGDRTVGFTKILQDMTERRRSAELLRSVLDSALDGIVSLDEKGVVQSMNRAGERLFGYSRDEVVGRDADLLLPQTFANEYRGFLAGYLESGVAKVLGIERQVEGRRKDGSVFPLEISITEFHLDDLRLFTAVLRDLTERNRLEEQLRQSQKMEAVGQLAGGVAHDFNNLLTVINGYGELLAVAVDEGDPIQEFVHEIRQAGDRAATLTRQLLAFSRRQVLEPRVVNLNTIVASTEKMLQRLIGEDILLHSVLDPALSQVKVDPGQIEQVLLNLAVNARDAMPQGGTLTLETRNVEWDEEYCRLYNGAKPGLYVMVAMTDRGCGMPSEVQARIFEPFFTTKGPTQGTGLGLATVFGIVKQSGGHINVYSEVGFGTTFRVYLPALEGPRAEAPSMPSSFAELRGEETILLVEDEDAVRRIATHALESQGYHVLRAGNGREALELLERHLGTVDLVVTDVVMPEMGGRQLAEALRARDAKLQVLFMSGYTDDAVVRHGIIQAEEMFLQKPFVPLTLARKVREVLDRKRDLPAAPTSLPTPDRSP